MKSLHFILILGCSLGWGQSIDWHTIDGGGGTSTNGQFAVTGTIGQPDASRSEAGPFSVSGGFWSLLVLVQDTNAPLLSISWTRSRDRAIISWPFESAGFVLEETDDLRDALAGWQPSTAAVTTNSQFKFIVIPANVGNRFYRLKKED